MLDRRGREISYLRISVTDRCNLRCRYCMPEGSAAWMSQEELLDSEELLRLAGLLAELGIRRIRLTGGEPLARRDLPELTAALKRLPGVEWVGVTTNGLLLEERLPALLAAGIDGINLSLNALDRAQYAALTRRDALDQALAGLEAARRAAAAGTLALKVNCVLAEDNESQWVPLAELARTGIDVRFIELMPIGMGGTLPGRTQAQALERLEAAFGPTLPCGQEVRGGPGRYVTFAGFQGRVGFISAMSRPFCALCNRVRLTAAGFFKPCLQYAGGVDLRAMLRSGADDAAIRAAMEAAILQKPAAHHFRTGRDAGDEERRMNQIGG